MSNKLNKISHLIYTNLFDIHNSHGWGRRVERWIAFLIVISVLAVVAEHTPALAQNYPKELHGLDVLSIFIFSIEYILRVFSAPQHEDFAQYRYPRLRYAVSFYALVDFVAIAPFYFAQFVHVDVEALRVLRLLRLLRMLKFSRQLIPAWLEFLQLNQGRSLRQKVFALMEPTGHSGRLHYLIDNFIVTWIALSIFCVVMESVDSVREIFADQFRWVDTIAFTLFTLEYLARLYSAPEKTEFKYLSWPRWAHIRSGQAIIDLVTILPFLFEHLLPVSIDLRFLRVFRLIRMLKFTRYTSATQTLFKVFKREWPVMAAAIFVMMLLVVLMASLGYLFEHDAQPDKYPNIPVALYWAVITLASVGYGDISPITPMGRLLTVLTSLAGIGIFAIPAGLLASAFTDQLKLDREDFRRKLVEAYKDGELSRELHQEIMAESERLHLTTDEFQKLVKEAKQDLREREAEAIQYGHLMLDVQQHPAYTAEQFGIIVAQLKLLHSVLGHEKLNQELAKKSTPDCVDTRICALLSKAQAH
jgi:hypothetical protein